MLLRTVDKNWIEHIENMEELKQGIRLRAFAQQDPLIAFKTEGSDMYDEMNETIRRETVELLFKVKIRKEQEIKREQVAAPVNASHGDGSDNSARTVVKPKKVGRNDPCPCGSGKKYKQCCGRNE